MSKVMLVFNKPERDCRECPAYNVQFMNCNVTGKFIDAVREKVQELCPASPIQKKL